MDNDIESILNGDDEEPLAAPETEPVIETPIERPRDEHGRFAPKGEQEPAPAPEPAPAESAPPAPEDDSPTVPRKALLDERNKRQTLEQQIAELNARINQFQQPPAPVLQPPPDPILDPESHSAYVVEQASRAAEQTAIATFQRQHVMMSAEAAKVKYPDYLEKVHVFQDLAQQNPALNAQMLQHPNPAEYAYSVAKQHEELSQYGSLEARDAALKAKWEAEALEKLKAQVPAQSVPPSIAGDRSIGARTGPAWSGPASMEDLLTP